MQVEVRFIDLDQSTYSEAWDLITELERERANRLTDDVARHRFVARRAFRRITLAARLGVDAASVVIEDGPRGKPEVEGLSFNASSSGACAVIVMSERGPIGVDVERGDRLHEPSVLSRAFSTDERRRLAGEPDEQSYLLWTWTRKEAVAKAIGTGLGVTPRSFESFSVLDAVIPDPRPGVEGEWWLAELAAPAGYVAALATPDEAVLR